MLETLIYFAIDFMKYSAILVSLLAAASAAYYVADKLLSGFFRLFSSSSEEAETRASKFLGRVLEGVRGYQTSFREQKGSSGISTQRTLSSGQPDGSEIKSCGSPLRKQPGLR